MLVVPELDSFFKTDFEEPSPSLKPSLPVEVSPPNENTPVLEGTGAEDSLIMSVFPNWKIKEALDC